MAFGTVKKLFADKGYGFIRPADDSRDVFLHATELRGLAFDETLLEREVEYEVESSERGLRAVNVRAAR